MYFMKNADFRLFGKKVNLKWVGIMFAFATVLSSFGTGSLPQINSISNSMFSSFGIDKMLTGGILAVLLSDKVFAFFLLPLVGVCLQGSTSITYGAVGDLVREDRVSRGFAIIYSVSSLSGLLGPIAFGLLSDKYGIETTMVAMAAISLLAIPPIILLRSKTEEAT